MTDEELELVLAQLHNIAPFDVQLSLAIDACHDELNALWGKRGVWAWIRRWWVTRRLRRLQQLEIKR